MTPALFLVRCKELGLSLAELDELTEGMVLDMFTEKGNDEWYQNHDPVYLADSTDFERF